MLFEIVAGGVMTSEPKQHKVSADKEKINPEGMTEEEVSEKLKEHFRQQRVSDVLLQFIVSLSNLAYIKMGLTEDTQDVKDLSQARLAIDSFKGLLDTAASCFKEQDKKALAGALASMQLTFVKVSSKEGDGSKTAGGNGKKKSDPASRLWVPGKN